MQLNTFKVIVSKQTFVSASTSSFKVTFHLVSHFFGLRRLKFHRTPPKGSYLKNVIICSYLRHLCVRRGTFRTGLVYNCLTRGTMIKTNFRDKSISQLIYIVKIEYVYNILRRPLIKFWRISWIPG